MPAAVLPLAVAAFTWNSHLQDAGEHVAPNVSFLGEDLSGLERGEVVSLIEARADEFESTEITVDLGDAQVVREAKSLGYRFDVETTVSDILEVRHGDGIWDEFTGWITAPFSQIEVEETYLFDEEAGRAELASEAFTTVEAVEPIVDFGNTGSFYSVPGTAGTHVDVEEAVSTLRSAPVDRGPLTITPPLSVIPTETSSEAAAALAEEVNDVTSEGLVALVGGQSGRLDPAALRRAFDVELGNGSTDYGVDVDRLQEELEKAFPEPIGQFVKPRIEVRDGLVEVVATGSAPAACCDRDSVALVAEQMLEGQGRTFRVLTRPNEDPVLQAWADGSLITEEVTNFTTRHACCENRVVNIQTIADTMTGYYLLPGETLSLNEYVGPRTRAKGYLPAGAIRSGHLTDEVGGGISQFVTTLFNAAYFGGLDLDEYQSHSVYFTRYPFGREATMSIPGPDLVLTNSTDHPVLIWPTYTANSITVSLYSTKNVQVEELGQRVFRRNQCRHVQTDRQRTFSDGRVVVDTIIANYRPGDGLDCNGAPIPQP